MTDTFTELQRLVRERLHADQEIAPETTLIADLGLDSIEQLDLVVEIENHFAVCLEPDDDQEVTTIGELVAWIERARKAETPNA
jgi:acyl carrier protein